MKTLFLIILLIHGLLHLPGFIKAFWPAAVESLSQSVSRPMGILWLLSSILFLGAFIFYFFKQEWWPTTAIVATILSQFLISMYWEDAKYGTLLNLTIMFVNISAHGKTDFNRTVNEEISGIFASYEVQDYQEELFENAHSLPSMVRDWVQNAGMAEAPDIVSVRLKQKGEMKTTPGGIWMPFSAEQYFNVKNPAFIWKAEVRPVPFLYLDARDKFAHGEGEMLIKALSLVEIAKEAGNEKINSGSMLRFLAELCWFPSAAKSPYLHWEVIGKNVARATFTLSEREVSGLFRFSENGDLVSFEAQRYMGSGKDAKQELWLIEVVEHRNFGKYRVPGKCKVTWKLSDGDFNWLNLEVTEMEYNSEVPYHISH